MRKALLLLGLALAGCSEPPDDRASLADAFPQADRPIAETVSGSWASAEERDAVDESGQVVRGLGIRSGMTVADIGAGSGYHTVRLSPVVGANGRVYAQDVTDTYLALLRQEVAQRQLKNVEVVEGAPDDPRLPGAVDRAILVHMYHEVAQPYALLWNLASSMKPEGRVGVVDIDRRPEDHGMPPALLRCEFEAVGYRQVGFSQLQGNVGYLAVFAPPALGKRPSPGAIQPCRLPRRTEEPGSGG